MQMELNDAVERAITECIQDGILAFIQDKQEDGIAPELSLRNCSGHFLLPAKKRKTILTPLSIDFI